jgi:hypothetical protein
MLMTHCEMQRMANYSRFTYDKGGCDVLAYCAITQISIIADAQTSGLIFMLQCNIFDAVRGIVLEGACNSGPRPRKDKE